MKFPDFMSLSLAILFVCGCGKSRIAPEGSKESSTETVANFDASTTMYGRNCVKGTSTYVSTIAGDGVSGSGDGPGEDARLSFPKGLAIDRLGNIYVADASNHKIRKISPMGVVSTLAGSGTMGSTDGQGAEASFEYPNAVAVDKNFNVYVAEHNKIRKIRPSGLVSTLAGDGTFGSDNGPGNQASFSFPEGIAVDKIGNVYVADTYGYKIRKITPSGWVSTFAGTGTFGQKDGPRTSAMLGEVVGLVFDSEGNLFFTDTYAVRKINPAGVVSTYAGSDIRGERDGRGKQARFVSPKCLAFDRNGNLYVADALINKIRKIDKSRAVSTYAGNGTYGSTDGDASIASFNAPYGLVFDAAENLLVSDQLNNKIRIISNRRLFNQDLFARN